ncbi:MAG TPA: hypothetical protein VGD67_24875 [Pseudonocardiaceae bacterium]
MLTEAALEAAGAELAGRFAGREYGAIRVCGATSAVVADGTAERGVALHLRLAPATDAWPPDVIADLRRDVRAEVRTFPEQFSVRLHFRAAAGEEPTPA